ncbi:MAG TPA: serpin family protein [Propionicimonas sp.]|nr:serpin family protein [Propionicimonas sp.]
MNRRELLSLATAVGAGSLLSGCASTPPAALPSPSSTPSPVAPAEIQPGLPGFAGQLFGALAPGNSNIVFSPWSIATVLSMVREGAVGATAAELDTLLGATAPEFGDSLAAGARAMQAAGGRLAVANCLWGQQGLGWSQPFLTRLETTYRAPLRQADFASDAEAARLEINQWVDHRTRGKIPTLIDPGLIDELTRLVLVNALHFKAPWSEPMVELGSRSFATAEGKKVMVPTLTGAGNWPWLSTTDANATAIPCEGRDFALVVALPKDATSRGFVDPSTCAKVLEAPPAPVSVQLPAWKFRLKVKLTEILKQLGLRLAFDDRADFSGMTTQEQLQLGFVVHEALIEVNAKGIEAAAATAGGMGATGALVDPKELVLNRPFSYALMHVATATPLFLGRVGDPSVESVG